jgi:hypothetical protein
MIVEVVCGALDAFANLRELKKFVQQGRGRGLQDISSLIHATFPIYDIFGDSSQ